MHEQFTVGLTIATLGEQAAQLGGARPRSLYRVEWTPFALPAAEPSDGFVVVEPELRTGDVPAAVRANVDTTLRLIRDWLADERQAHTKLIVVTRGTEFSHLAENVTVEAGKLTAVKGALKRLVRGIDADGFRRTDSVHRLRRCGAVACGGVRSRSGGV